MKGKKTDAECRKTLNISTNPRYIERLMVALTYFFYFAILGVTVPYLSPVLLELGYSKMMVGAIWALMYLCHTVTPILTGRISDKYLSAERTIRISALCLTFFALLMWWQASTSSFLFLAALFAFAASRSPAVALQDTLAMQVADNDPHKFSRIRVMGSIGFALTIILFGYLAGFWGKQVFFAVTFCVCVLFLTCTFFLPRERKKTSSQARSAFWKSLSLTWWMWLLAMMCHFMGFGPYHYGFTLLLEEQGVATQWTGWFWVIGVGAEVFFFLVSGFFFSRFRYRTLLFAAFFANLVRWLLLGFYPEPWLIALSQLLHGPGFALFYAAAMQGIFQYCGGVDRASYQGLFSTCVGGVASIIGTYFAGRLHDMMPFRDMILWFVPLQGAAILLLVFFPLKQMRNPN